MKKVIYAIVVLLFISFLMVIFNSVEKTIEEVLDTTHILNCGIRHSSYYFNQGEII